MKSVVLITDIVYMLLLLGGGAMGYAKAKSSASLIGGVVAAVVALIAGLLYAHHPRVSLGLALVLGVAMEILFIVRLRKTGNAMPAIPIIVASGLVQIVQVVAIVMKH